MTIFEALAQPNIAAVSPAVGGITVTFRTHGGTGTKDYTWPIADLEIEALEAALKAVGVVGLVAATILGGSR